jgi:hypothetical protein
MRKNKAVNTPSPVSRLSGLQKDTQMGQAIKKVGIAEWPRQIDWEFMRQCQQRWSDYRTAENVGSAIIKCMLAIAQLQTHDPIVLQRHIGYPLRFLSSLIWNLTQNESWLSEQGYLDLIQAVSLARDKELDDLLFWLLEKIVTHSSQRVVDLEEEWYECTGVPVGA